MVNSRIMVLIRRKKTDMIDADVTIDEVLQPAVETVLNEKEREN
jgi:hypothetical protein